MADARRGPATRHPAPETRRTVGDRGRPRLRRSPTGRIAGALRARPRLPRRLEGAIVEAPQMAGDGERVAGLGPAVCRHRPNPRARPRTLGGPGVVREEHDADPSAPWIVPLSRRVVRGRGADRKSVV